MTERERPPDAEEDDPAEELDEQVPAEEVGEPVPLGESQGGTDEEGGTKTDKRVRDAQEALRKSNQDNADLRKDIAKMQGQMEVLVRTRVAGEAPPVPQQQDPLGFLDEEEFQSTLFEDPKNVTKAIKMAAHKLVETMQLRDRYLMEEIDKRTPEAEEVAEKMEELEQDDSLRGLSRQQLKAVAKKMLSSDKPREEVVDDDEPIRPTSLGGGRRQGGVVRRQSQEEKEIAAWMRKMGYDKMGGS